MNGIDQDRERLSRPELQTVHARELLENLALGPTPKKYRTGIPSLDRLTKGIWTGEVIAIGGPRKNGKTLLAQTITNNLRNQGTVPLWFSYEVPPRQFLDQMPDEPQFRVPAKLRFADCAWVIDCIIASKLEHDTRVIFIDNLHFLIDLSRRHNISLELGDIIRRLKRCAVEENVAIFILCHSRKPDVQQDGSIVEPSDYDLRDSSFISQETDSTWMVWRTTIPLQDGGRAYEDSSNVKICVHRRTGTMEEIVRLNKVDKLFMEDSNDAGTPKDAGTGMGKESKERELAFGYDPDSFTEAH